MEAFIVICWLVLCAAVGFYAAGKGRSGVGIFFLSLFLSPLVGLVVALAMRPDEKKVAAAQGMKRCPECAEFVQPEAKICRFCQHKFTEEEQVAAEAAQLAAANIPPVPPCPKCGSVSTFVSWEKTRASRWWKEAQTRFLRCRKCKEKWQQGDSEPAEKIADWVTLTALFAAGILITLVLLLIIGRSRGTTTDTVPASTHVDSQSQAVPTSVTNDAELLVYRCGKPDEDRSTAYDNPRPPIPTRLIFYRKARLMFAYTPGGGAKLGDPPYSWKLLGIKDTRTNRVLQAGQLKATLSQRLPCAVEKPR